jgi:hypothetical protein
MADIETPESPESTKIIRRRKSDTLSEMCNQNSKIAIISYPLTSKKFAKH